MYNNGRSIDKEKLHQKSSLNILLLMLLTTLNTLQTDHESEDSKVPTYLTKMLKRKPKLQINGYTFLGTDKDYLYQAECHHPVGNATCDQCDRAHEVYRPSRGSTEPQVHYRVIASGNQVVKDGSPMEPDY